MCVIIYALKQILAHAFRLVENPQTGPPEKADVIKACWRCFFPLPLMPLTNSTGAWLLRGPRRPACEQYDRTFRPADSTGKAWLDRHCPRHLSPESCPPLMPPRRYLTAVGCLDAPAECSPGCYILLARRGPGIRPIPIRSCAWLVSHVARMRNEQPASMSHVAPCRKPDGALNYFTHKVISAASPCLKSFLSGVFCQRPAAAVP